MTRTKNLLPLFGLLLVLPVALGLTAEAPAESVDVSLDPAADAPDAPAAGIPGSEADNPGVGLAPEVPEPFHEGERIEACAGCTGTLGTFIDPSCRTCNVNESACELACESHGGVAAFSCGAAGIYCECEDGVYDSCGCGSDPVPPLP